MITSNGKSIELNRLFNCSVETLFRAWSDPAIFRAWWKDLSLVEMDFRVGGAYRLQWTNDPESQSSGVYRVIEPTKKIVFTWDTAGCESQSDGAKGSLVTLQFTRVGPETSRLELTHEGLTTEEAIDGHHLGWTCALLDLDTSLNAPTRKIREDLRVVVEREFAAPVAELYRAWTHPALINRWFNRAGNTLGKARSNTQVGRMRYMDYQRKDGNLIRIYSEYLEVVPEKKLVFTWLDDGDCTSDGGGDAGNAYVGYESRVSVTFEKLSADRSKLILVHDRLTDDSAAEGFREGWNDCLRSIDEEIVSARDGVYVTREFPVSVDALYAACATPTFLAETGAVVGTGRFDFRVGGTYDFVVGGSLAGDFVRGTFLQIVPNERIVFTWDTRSKGTEETGDTTVTLVFTKVSETHSRLDLGHTGFRKREHRDDHLAGWTEILGKWELATV